MLGTVFVTGGTGFIGSVVVRKLHEAGYSIKCLVRNTSDKSRLDGIPCEIVPGNILDFHSLDYWYTGCDAVIHLAGPSSWDEIAQSCRPIVDGMSNILNLVDKHKCPRTVFVSSIATIGGTDDPIILDERHFNELNGREFSYARAKATAERMCLSSGLPIIIVNPAETYGPDDYTMVTAGNLLPMLQGDPVVVCSGGTSIVHVDDVAAGVVAALEHGRVQERYILGGENITLRQIAELSLFLVGSKSPVVEVPRWSMRLAGKIASFLKLRMPISPAAIPYSTLYWFMDNTKAKNELGVSFRSAADTLLPTLEWLMQERV